MYRNKGEFKSAAYPCRSRSRSLAKSAPKVMGIEVCGRSTSAHLHGWSLSSNRDMVSLAAARIKDVHNGQVDSRFA